MSDWYRVADDGRITLTLHIQPGAKKTEFAGLHGEALKIRLAAQSSEPASLLRERVTSKGGTTEAALKMMAEKGVKEGIVAGCHAAEARGKELGKLLGAD